MTLSKILLAMLAVLPSTAIAQAAEDTGKPNAALCYWPMCLEFHTTPWSDADRKILYNPMDAPRGDETERVLRWCGRYLRGMHRGAAMPHCEWQVDWSGGPTTLLPHVQNMRPLASVFLLRARYFLSKRQSDSATEDLADALTLGRHLAMDGSIPGLLIQFQLQTSTAQVAADNFDRFDRPAFILLSERLDSMARAARAAPTLGTMKATSLGWLRREVMQKGTETVKPAVLYGWFDKSDGELLDELLSGTPEEVLGRIADGERMYDLAAELLELPADQFDAAYQALMKEAEASGPLTAYWLRDTQVKRLRDREVEAQAKLAMLRAALAMAIDGVGALKRSPDPFGDGPFELTKDDDGFELKSKLVVDQKPVQLRFQRALP